MKPSAWLITGLTIAVLLASSIFVVPEGRSAIVTNLGRISRPDVGPGLHLRFPFVERLRIVDRRTALFPIESDRYATADGKSVGIDFVAIGRVQDAVRYAQATGGDPDVARARLTEIVKGAVRGPLGERTLQELVSGGRLALAAQLPGIDAKAATLGLHITDLRIGAVELPSDGRFMAEVYGRMKADRQAAASLARAGGAEQARRIRADADRQGVVLVAEAQRDAQRIRGEGEAEAARLYAEAAQKDPAFYAFQRSLEAYGTAFGNGQAVIVLDRDDPFLQYLKSDR